jgi:hypothetical protein
VSSSGDRFRTVFIFSVGQKYTDRAGPVRPVPGPAHSSHTDEREEHVHSRKRENERRIAERRQSKRQLGRPALGSPRQGDRNGRTNQRRGAGLSGVRRQRRHRRRARRDHLCGLRTGHHRGVRRSRPGVARVRRERERPEVPGRRPHHEHDARQGVVDQHRLARPRRLRQLPTSSRPSARSTAWRRRSGFPRTSARLRP